MKIILIVIELLMTYLAVKHIDTAGHLYIFVYTIMIEYLKNCQGYIFGFFIFYFSLTLKIESRTMCVLGKHFTTALVFLLYINGMNSALLLLMCCYRTCVKNYKEKAL